MKLILEHDVREGAIRVDLAWNNVSVFRFCHGYSA